MIQIKREYFRIGIRKQANNQILQQKRKNLLNQVVQENDKEILDLIENLQNNQYCLLKDRNLLLTVNKLFNELQFINQSVVNLMQSILIEYNQYQKQISYEKKQMDDLISNMISDMLKYLFLTLRVKQVGKFLTGGQFLSQLVSIMTDTKLFWVCQHIFQILSCLYAEEDESIINYLNTHNMIHISLNQIMQFCSMEIIQQYEQFVEYGLELINNAIYCKKGISEQELYAINFVFWKIMKSNNQGLKQITINFIKIFIQITKMGAGGKQNDNFNYIFITQGGDADGKKQLCKYQDQSIIQWIIEKMYYYKENDEFGLQFKVNVHELLMELTFQNNCEYIYYLLQYGITSCLLNDIKTNNQEIFNIICCTLSNIVCENQKTKNEIAQIQIFHYLYESLQDNTKITNLDHVIDFITDSLESQDNDYFNILIDQDIYGLILICLNYCKTKTDYQKRLNNILQGITNIYRTQITHIQDQQLYQNQINIHKKDFILNFFREQPQLETLIQQTIENLDNPECPQLTFDNLMSLINSEECIKYDELLQNL